MAHILVVSETMLVITDDMVTMLCVFRCKPRARSMQIACIRPFGERYNDV